MSLVSAPSSRAVVCVRVSPRPAENVRYSPEIQERMSREWCSARGIPVVRVIQDILVSGGSANRFDSIMRALTDDHPTHFVVQNIDRWTKDHPMRYWTMRSLLEEQGVTLVSVEQPYLGDDSMPFSATIATATVEANYIQRLESNKKTSKGVRTAWAKGKRFGKIWGWTFDERTREYTQDVEKIRAFYQDVVDGRSTWEIAQRYGCRPTHVAVHARAVSQKDVVGEELWLRAQQALLRGHRTQRRGAQQSNIFRGLLICPWCGEKLQHRSNAWGNYLCQRVNGHGWRSISAPTHVVPPLQELLARLTVPVNEYEAKMKALEPEPEAVVDPTEIREEIERLGLLWASKRLSDRTYEERVAKLEALLVEKPAPVPAHEQVQIMRSLSKVNLLDRHPESGSLANWLLRTAIHPIVLGKDRKPEIRLREEWSHWLE